MAVTISQTSTTSGDRWGVTSSYNTVWPNFVQVTNTESYTIYVTSIKIYIAVLANGYRCALAGGTSYYGDGKPISLTFTASSKSSTPETISNTIGSTKYTQSQTTGEGTLTLTGYKPNTITTQHTFTFSDPVPVASNTTVKFVYSATSPSGSSLSNSVTCWEHSGNYALSCTWNQGQYIVVFNGNTNTGGSTANQTFVVGTAQNLNANGFTKTGYSFAGWATTSTGAVAYANQASVNNLASAGGTFNLYAKWSANTYAITLDRQSGSGGSSSTTATYASAMPSISVPSRTGYTFQGYYTSTSGGGTKYYNADGTSAKAWDIASATTLYAYWTVNSYYVDVNSIINGTTQSAGLSGFTFTVYVGGTASATNVIDYYQAVSYGSSVRVVANAKSGYTLTNGDTTQTVGTSGCVFNPTWAINSYTVTYDKNGGSSTPSSQSGNYNSSITLRAGITRSESESGTTYTVSFNANGHGTAPSALTAKVYTTYAFSSWKSSVDNKTYSGGASYTIPASNTTMTAQWTTGSRTDSITLPTISDPNNQYIFKGWSTSSTATSGSTGSYTPSSNVTLYATWAENKFTVTYNSNGGTGTIASVTKLYNQTITLASSGFTKSGCKLIGWNTKADGNGTKYALGRTNYAVTANVTLYAVWYTNFSWTSDDSIYIASNQRISYATADKWNLLQNNIKKYVDSSFTVTTASAGSVIEASKIVTAANKLGVSTSGITKNTVVYPRVFNDLRDQINDQATYLGVS